MASNSKIQNSGVPRWWPVVLLALLGAIAGYGYARLADPTYIARAYVAAVARGAGDNAAAASYAEAYARMAPQGDVVSAAVRASGGGVSPGEFRRQVQASTSPEGPVMEIAASGSDPQRAADLANLVAAGVISSSARHAGQTRIDFILLSSADPPVDPASPRTGLDVLVGAAVGLLLGGLVMLAGTGRGQLRPGRTRPVGVPAGAGRGEPRDGSLVRPVPNVTVRPPVRADSHRNPYHDVPPGSDHAAT